MADEVVVVTVGVSMALAFLGLVGAYAARYKRVPPGHAMVVFGRRFGDRRYQVIVGGGRFIQPIVESYVLISLEPISIECARPASSFERRWTPWACRRL